MRPSFLPLLIVSVVASVACSNLGGQPPAVLPDLPEAELVFAGSELVRSDSRPRDDGGAFGIDVGEVWIAVYTVDAEPADVQAFYVEALRKSGWGARERYPVIGYEGVRWQRDDVRFVLRFPDGALQPTPDALGRLTYEILIVEVTE